MDSHTCSILRFCPPANAQTEDAQIVYRMLDEESMNSCDFDTATEIGTTLQAGSDDGCVEYAFEEDHELTDYFFSSPEGCDSGQKLMIHIEDFTETAEQCKAIGNASSRIRNCDCRFEKKESTLPEPCRTAFSDQCEFMTVKTDTCCEEGTCLSKIEDYNDPLGKEAETKRQAECDDNTPGLCYNEDGLGTDTNRQGSTNCCTRTCTECGIQDNPFALWKPCTSGNANDQTANCGFLSRYDQEAFVCDFSKCEEDDHWHPSRDPYKKYFKIVEDSNQQDDTNQDDSSASMVDYFFPSRLISKLFDQKFGVHMPLTVGRYDDLNAIRQLIYQQSRHPDLPYQESGHRGTTQIGGYRVV
eukprot:scaffold6369_cov99-Cylindrotheca_fusiformis.AAC.3